MNDTNPKPEPSLYSRGVDRLIDRMGLVLSRGRETQLRCESFYARHGLEPGFGEERLTDPRLPERVVRSTRAALALQQAVFDAFLPVPDGERPTPPAAASATASAAVRALRSHTRI
jgi:hypothetical protein